MTEQDKKLVHELTLEYIRQRDLLNCVPECIPEQMKTIIKAENIIADYIQNNRQKFKSL